MLLVPYACSNFSVKRQAGLPYVHPDDRDSLARSARDSERKMIKTWYDTANAQYSLWL